MLSNIFHGFVARSLIASHVDDNRMLWRGESGAVLTPPFESATCTQLNGNQCVPYVAGACASWQSAMIADNISIYPLVCAYENV